MRLGYLDDEDCLAPQEDNAVGPVQIIGFLSQVSKGSNQATDIRRGYGFFVNEDYSTMIAAGFRPDFQQGRNSPAVVSYQRQTLAGSGTQAGRVVVTKKRAVFPFGHSIDFESSDAPAQTGGHAGRNVLIEKQFEHLPGVSSCERKTFRPAAT
jgi:glucose/arabinose dehydrogenase